MKKLRDGFFIILIMMGVVYFMTGSFVKNKTSDFAQNFNRFNLQAKRSPKFMQIDYQDSDQESDGSYTYYADSYDRQGNYHDIVFNSDDDLKEGQYLKLDTKGNYIKGYKKIQANDMPYKVYNIFQE